jgi:hypothetical protein
VREERGGAIVGDDRDKMRERHTISRAKGFKGISVLGKQGASEERRGEEKEEKEEKEGKGKKKKVSGFYV